jgi:hypothetical protein
MNSKGAAACQAASAPTPHKHLWQDHHGMHLISPGLNTELFKGIANLLMVFAAAVLLPLCTGRVQYNSC